MPLFASYIADIIVEKKSAAPRVMYCGDLQPMSDFDFFI